MKIQLSDFFSYRRLLKFTLPSILSMLFTSIYGVVDGLFVSNIAGETAFASLNLIIPYCMIFSAIGSIFGVGGGALVALRKGQKDDERANKVFSMLVYGTILVGIAITILAEFLLPSVAMLLGATEAMMADCLLYGRIFLSTQTAFLMQFAFQSFLVVAERPRLSLVFTIAAGGTNIILDWLFIAVFQWGVAGAAIASCIGQCIGGIGPVIFFVTAKDCPLKLVKTSFMPKEMLKAIGNGTADGITSVALSLVNMVFNYQLMRYIGEYGVSAYGVIMYVNFVFVAVYVGYSMGVAPIISYKYGAGSFAEMKGVFKKSIAIITLFSVGLTGLALITARWDASVFAGYDEKFLNLTTRALRLYSLSYIFAGINIFAPNLFAALNDGLIAGILSILRFLVFQLLAVLLMPLIWGSEGIWFAMVVAESCVFVITFIVLRRNREKYHYD